MDAEPTLRRVGLVRPGGAVTVAYDSPATNVTTWTFGELPDHRPAMVHTPLYVASVTKQFVAALVARQILARDLDVDDRITELLPDLPAWAAGIRVRHLLHHTSGLPGTGRVLSAVGLSTQRDLDNTRVREGLRRLATPDAPPGQVFAYSNVGYVLLAEVLHTVTRRPVPELARDAFFAPLALRASHFVTPEGLAEQLRPPRTIGDGGLWTSATDLLTWLDALNRDRLGADLTRLLQTPGHLDDGTPLDYAWGMTARPGPAGTSYTHGGHWPGWTAKTVRCPTRGTAVALLTTSNDVDAVSRAGVDLHELLTHSEPRA